MDAASVRLRRGTASLGHEHRLNHARQAVCPRRRVEDHLVVPAAVALPAAIVVVVGVVFYMLVHHRLQCVGRVGTLVLVLEARAALVAPTSARALR